MYYYYCYYYYPLSIPSLCFPSFPVLGKKKECSVLPLVTRGYTLNLGHL